jgi:hypothetical protein
MKRKSADSPTRFAWEDPRPSSLPHGFIHIIGTRLPLSPRMVSLSRAAPTGPSKSPWAVRSAAAFS